MQIKEEKMNKGPTIFIRPVSMEISHMSTHPLLLRCGCLCIIVMLELHITVLIIVILCRGGGGVDLRETLGFYDITEMRHTRTEM